MAGIEHTAGVTKLVNAVLGPLVGGLLTSLGIEHDAHLPIPNHVAITWVVMLGLIGFAWFAGRRLERIPGTMQNFLELFWDMMRSLCRSAIGDHKGMRYVSLIAAMALYVFWLSAIGLVPFFASPTANLNTTLSLAVLVFVYYNIEGVRAQGLVPYIRHFAGPNLGPLLLPINALLFPIELISHLARPISLALRLFANIFGDDVILVILITLVGFTVLPIQPLMFLGLFKAFVQTYIFIMLTAVYLAGAVAEEGH